MEEIARRVDALMGREAYDEVEALLTEKRAEAREAGNASLELSLCNEELGFCRMTNRREGFDALLARTRTLLEQVHISPLSRGTILINAATALSAFGRGREGLPLYTEAEGCYARAMQPRDRRFAALYNNVAGCLESLGDSQGAEREYRRALNILESYPHDPDRAVSYVNLAQLYFSRDRSDSRVGEMLDIAMELLDDPELLWDGYYAHTVTKCAGAFEALGQADRGRDLRERAEIVYEGT